MQRIASMAGAAVFLATPCLANDLSVDSFGPWAARSALIEFVGTHRGLARGLFARPDRLPTSGSATYTGPTAGGATVNGVRFNVTGTESLAVDFGHVSTAFGPSEFGRVATFFALDKRPQSGGPTTFFTNLVPGQSPGSQSPAPIEFSTAQGLHFTQVVSDTGGSGSLLKGTASGTFIGRTGPAILGSWNITNAPFNPDTVTAHGGFIAARK